MVDVFVSYSAEDRLEVERVVSALERRGLSVWWDQRIEEHEWGPQIEENLSSARRVLAFISQNAVNSKKYYIVAEMDRALSENKLIPIQVGRFTQPLIFAGLTFGRQIYYFENFDDFIADKRFLDICNLCKRDNIGTSVTPMRQTAAQWLDHRPGLSDIALAFAVAAMETAPLSIVLKGAALLEQNLKEVLGQGIEDLGDNDGYRALLTPRRQRMDAIGAVIYHSAHRRYGEDVEHVRFVDPRRGLELFAYVWEELDLFRQPLVNWLEQLAEARGIRVRLRLGLMIGALARVHFMAVFEALISPWALQNNKCVRDVADVALSVVAMDCGHKSTVAAIIKEWAHSNNEGARRAAIEVSCGYTGFRYENLSISILKTLAASSVGNVKMYEIMGDAVDFLFTEISNADDNTLLDIGKLFEALADWSEKAENEAVGMLPLYLFLRVMRHTPLMRKRETQGRFSLEDLVKDRFAIPTAQMFAISLRKFGDKDFSPRKEAQNIISMFMEKTKEINSSGSIEKTSDVLLKLVQNIYLRAGEQNDQHRILFCVRSLYTEEDVRKIEYKAVLTS